MPTIITAAVEGPTDEAVAQRLVSHVGANMGAVFGKQGKPNLRLKLSGYNNAARYDPWFILMDLDRDADCVPSILSSWLPDPAPMICFRVAVREVEAWLMADGESLADFLGISITKIPNRPEVLDEPKTALVNLARSSRRRAIRDDMVPRAGSGRSTGPAYTSRLIEFASRSWRPDVAAQNSDSLARAIKGLYDLLEHSKL